MKKYKILLLIFPPVIILCSMNADYGSQKYFDFYFSKIDAFDKAQQDLITYIESTPQLSPDKRNGTCGYIKIIATRIMGCLVRVTTPFLISAECSSMSIICFPGRRQYQCSDG